MLLDLSFSSEIASFAKEFAFTWSDILPSFCNKVLPDVFISALFYNFKVFYILFIMPRITYLLGSGKISCIVCSFSCCHVLT